MADLKSWKPYGSGGTTPHVIFEGPGSAASLQAIQESDVFDLMTDGEISQSDVQKLTAHVQVVSHKPVILVITHTGSKPSKLNVSVCAPFIAGCAHVLTISNPTNGKPRILHSTGVFTELGVAPDMSEGNNRESWDAYPLLDFGRLLDLPLPVGAQMPPGCIAVSTGGVTRYLSIDALLRTTLTAFELIDVMQYRGHIILTCKTRGITAELRQWISRHLQLHDRDDITVDRNGEAEILHQIRTKISAKFAKDHPDLVELRKHLTIARERNAAYMAEHRDEITALKNLRRVLQTTQADLTAAEKAGYGADILSSLSNRAMRAERIDPNAQVTIPINWYGCCTVECSICMDNKPAALLFRPVEDSALNTTDWAIDFALSKADDPQNNVVLPDVICYDCAQQVSKVRRTVIDPKSGAAVEVQGVSPLGREGIKMVFPVVDIKHNQDLYKNILAIALTTGIKTNNLVLLFFGILHRLLTSVDWCDAEHPDMRGVVTYMYENILDHYKTSDTFREGGNYVTLRTALETVWKVRARRLADVTPANNILYDYPLPGTCLILQYLHNQGLISPAEYVETLSNRISRHIVSRYMAMVLRDSKNGTTDAASFRQVCREMLFKCRFGVPIRGTARCIDNVCPLLADYDVAQLTACVKQIGDASITGITSLMDTAALTLMIAKMCEYTQHNSVSNLVAQMSQDELIARAFYRGLPVPADIVVVMLNDRYDYGRPNHDHTVPQFVTVYGPSVLKCVCGYVFCPDAVIPHSGGNCHCWNCVWGQYGGNDQQSQDLMARRKEHFAQVYGADTEWGMPGNRSTSYNLHRGVQMTFNPDLTDEENIPVIAKYIVTRDRRGNIYDDDMEDDIRVLLPRYRELFADAQRRGILIDDIRTAKMSQKIAAEIAAPKEKAEK